MSEREEIFELINTGRIDDAFMQLQSSLDYVNDDINELEDQFISPPENFNPTRFRARLKAAVNRLYIQNNKITTPELPASYEFSDHDLLYEFDFKDQTQHFTRIFKYKTIALFLLQAGDNREGHDSNWFCKQICKSAKSKKGGPLISDIPIFIDFSTYMGTPFERLMEDLYNKFEVKNDVRGQLNPKNFLRKQIEDRLLRGNIFCVIKSPSAIFDDHDAMKSLFDELLNFLHVHLSTDKQNTFIILFIENKPEEENKWLNQYFIWFTEEKRATYSSEIANDESLRIVDLAPVKPIEEKDIKHWIDIVQEKRDDIYLKIQQRKKSEECKEHKCYETFLLQGNVNPYAVIERICYDLKISNPIN